MEQPRTRAMGGAAESASPPAVGKVHAPDKYELSCCLGRGGTSVVYLARDRQCGRPVALKFLGEAGPADAERFRREAVLTARLNNPSIVKVYEMDEFEDRYYIAM